MVSAPATRKIQNSHFASLTLLQLGLRFLRDQVVGAAHEAHQEPHDEQIGVPCGRC